MSTDPIIYTLPFTGLRNKVRKILDTTHAKTSNVVLLFYTTQEVYTKFGTVSIEEMLIYCDFPSEHWTQIQTNNMIERLKWEIRRRRVVGSFPDSNSALMLVRAWLRHMAGTQWGHKKYMNIKHLEAVSEDATIAD